MRKKIFGLLVVISILVLGLRFGESLVTQILDLRSKSGIKITAKPEADVYLNGNKVGKTPFQDESLKPEEYDVKLVSDGGSWQGKVNLYNGTLSVVNRELSTSQASSSGEILTLSPGSGVIVTSLPEGSGVEIDGKDSGKTPVSILALSSGEHTFLFSHDNYIKRSIRATLPDKMTLSLSVDLAIAEADLMTVATPSIFSETKVTVKPTSTGFLRLRDKPSLDGNEIAKVFSGDQLVMVESLGTWTHVRMLSGLEGYVSSSYLAK